MISDRIHANVVFLPSHVRSENQDVLMIMNFHRLVDAQSSRSFRVPRSLSRSSL